MFNFRRLALVSLLLCTTSHAGRLHDAIRSGKLPLVIDFIAQGDDVNEPDDDGLLPLEIASKMERLDVVELLQSHGATIWFGLPWDVWAQIYMRLDPVDRNRMQLVCTRFRNIIRLMRSPISEGGCGLIDNFPCVANIELAGGPTPLERQGSAFVISLPRFYFKAANRLLYLCEDPPRIQMQRVVHVIDPVALKGISSLPGEREPQEASGEKFRASVVVSDTIGIFDCATNTELCRINVPGLTSVMCGGQFFYFGREDDEGRGCINVARIPENLIEDVWHLVARIEIGPSPQVLGICGEVLCAASNRKSWKLGEPGDNLVFIDTNTHTHLSTVEVGWHPQDMQIAGDFIIVHSQLAWHMIHIIRMATRSIIATITTESISAIRLVGCFLFAVNPTMRIVNVYDISGYSKRLH